jgi:hypothetical protein
MRLAWAMGSPPSFFVIASEAKQSSFVNEKLDCFVASLLAMTIAATAVPYIPPG